MFVTLLHILPDIYVCNIVAHVTRRLCLSLVAYNYCDKAYMLVNLCIHKTTNNCDSVDKASVFDMFLTK